MKHLMEKIDSLDEWKVAVVVITVATALYIVLINGDPLADIQEARNLVSARECVEDGSCLVTTLNGVPRVRKPPLPTWLAAAAMKASGDVTNIYAARVPLIPLIILLALSVYFFSRRWLGKSESLVAAAVVLTFGIMCNEGRRITWDICTVAFAFGGVWALFNALDRKRPAVPWILWAALFWTLSILSKGPLSPYAVLFPFLLSLMLTERRWEYRWWVVPVVGLIALPLSTSWWLYMYLAHPEVLGKMQAEAGRWTLIHDAGFLHYIIYLPAFVIPWTPAVMGSFLMPFMKNSDGGPLIGGERRRKMLFFLMWFAISLLLLSVAPQKKGRYFMTILLPLSIAVSIFLAEVRSSGLRGVPRVLRGLWKLQTYQLPAVAALLAGAVFYDILLLDGPLYMVLIVPLLAVFAFKVLKDKEKADTVIVGTALLVFFMALTLSLGARDYLSKDPRHDLAGAARIATLTSGEDLYYFGKNRKDRATWITRRKNIHITAKTVLEDPPAYVLVEKLHKEDFKSWAASMGFSFKATYTFRYKTVFTLFEPTGPAPAEVEVEVKG